MTIIEAVKKFNKFQRKHWVEETYNYLIEGGLIGLILLGERVDYNLLTKEDLLANDWEEYVETKVNK